ncbi:MAG: alpha-glucan family phosphorylase [Deltaproteobacteria bacterium]|jgi:starch phosphorylase|nr:alpha-glucan family phosphorylase [Deltaproteobacteria bacterium]MDL1987248.1 alpha-glucan family phosphorylase [Deltaproteobacteria bacterium]
MDHLQTFQVVPNIPEQLSFLEALSRNLWWSWKQDAIELFRRIDPRLWEESERNPIVFLTRISQTRFEELARDDSFLAHQERVKERFEKRACATADWSECLSGKQGVVAYFSMEFGIHESLPLFAGGLGILAGDHLKASSNMALPLVGVGLLYRQGYFRQFLDQDGWQQQEYPEIDIYNLPIERARDHSGNEIHVSVTGPDGEIHAVVWIVRVGCIPLYLLDTNLAENSSKIRNITARLYAGNPEMRLAQEVLLGIGGIRALAAIGINTEMCHMNEGHSAFSSLERIAQIMSKYNIDLKTALEIIPRATLFTTHTPVVAGYDRFPADLVKPYLRPLQKCLGATEDEILSWGQPPMQPDPNGPLSMFVLGLRMAQYCNGVSRLHGKVARRMWSHVWPKRPEDATPISHITNGVHLQSFLSSEYTILFERYLGPDWFMSSRTSHNIKRIDQMYGEGLWRAHEMNRSRLIGACRQQMVKQYGRRNAPKPVMEEVGSVLDHDILTIAFARRFTAYKRANLLLNDPERFEAILTSRTHPVQFIFAGKAHPKDHEGKELIQRLIKFSQRPSARHRIIFLENYDMHIARHLVQGADVWLNTPRRPFEACGTSGMKAAINGVLNMSILDGWWDEAYSENTGWRIGNGEEYADYEYQDSVESQALYNMLENDVIPCFYERKKGGYPGRWVKMMKESMKMAMLDFCSLRMVSEYNERFYIPAAKRLKSLLENDAKEAENLAAQRERLRANWDSIRIEPPVRETGGPFRAGKTFRVNAIVHLGKLSPEEVEVQLFYGKLKAIDKLSESHTEEMTIKEEPGNGKYLYTCAITCNASGRYGFTARVTASGDDRIRFTPGLITWAP